MVARWRIRYGQARGSPGVAPPTHADPRRYCRNCFREAHYVARGGAELMQFFLVSKDWTVNPPGDILANHTNPPNISGLYTWEARGGVTLLMSARCLWCRLPLLRLKRSAILSTWVGSVFGRNRR